MAVGHIRGSLVDNIGECIGTEIPRLPPAGNQATIKGDGKQLKEVALIGLLMNGTTDAVFVLTQKSPQFCRLLHPDPFGESNKSEFALMQCEALFSRPHSACDLPSQGTSRVASRAKLSNEIGMGQTTTIRPAPSFWCLNRTG